MEVPETRPYTNTSLTPFTSVPATRSVATLENTTTAAVRADGRTGRAVAGGPGRAGNVADERHRARGPLVEETSLRDGVHVRSRHQVGREAGERDERAVRADDRVTERRSPVVPAAPGTWLTSVTVPVARS